MTKIFNTDKTSEDYDNAKLFLNPPPGLVDTIHKVFPTIWKLYEEMRSLDWSESEFDFTTCLNDFEGAPSDVSDIMIKTLAWQWESDSIAARAPTVIIAPFSPATEVWAAEQRITDNEQCLHPDHQVFIKGKGWIPIADVREGDLSLNFDPKTQVMRFSPVRRVIAKRNDAGYLYEFRNKVGSIWQHVTPDHRMCVYRSRGEKGWEHDATPAEELNCTTMSRFALSGFKEDGNLKEITWKDRLWIAHQADGFYAGEKYNGQRTGTIPIHFSFKLERKKERMRYILEKLPYRWKAYERQNGYTAFSVWIPIDEFRHDSKTFGWVDLDNVTHRWAQEFIEEIKHWDGTRKRKETDHLETIYSTGVDVCADIVRTLSHFAGYRASKRWYKNASGGGVWQVNVNSRWHVNCEGTEKTKTDYDGMVYCLTVDEDAFLTKYKGVISVSHNCHANTYSEIVRTGMRYPEQVIADILEEQEAFRRLNIVNEKLSEIQKYSLEVGYKGLDAFPRDKHIEALMMFYFVMLCLERIQFMASFAITFTIAKSGFFQEIGQAVKKIAQDELEIHCEYRKEILREFMKTEEGMRAFNKLKDEFTAITKEVIDSEMYWTREFLFNGRSLVGTNADIVCNWVLFCAKDVIHTFNLDIDTSGYPKENPMPHLDDWLNPNVLQPAPQEQTMSTYKMNTVTNDVSDDDVFEF